MRSRARAVIYLLGVNVILTMALLVAVEGGVRVIHPQIQPLGTDAVLVDENRFGSVAGPRAGASGQSGGASLSADEEGFWQYDDASEQEGALTWLWLGDSVTMGLGVAPDSTFVGRLARENSAFALRNAALIGHGAEDYPVVLRHVLARRAVARITLVWCLNDAQPARADDPDAALRRRVGPVLRFLQRHVRTYAWAKATFADRPQRYLDHDRQYYEGEAFGPALAALAEVAALARDAGVPLDLVVIPYEAQLRPDAPAEALRPQERLAEATDSLGIRVLDATEALRGHGSARWYLYGDGIHLSAEGHGRIARFLTEML